MDDATLRRVVQWLEWILLVAAVAVIPVILIEQSHADSTVKTAAAVANWAIWVVFAVQAVFMLAVSTDRVGWARSHKLELAVVILTPPILPAGLQALRVLRLLRLLRLAVAVKLIRRLFTVDGVKYATVLTIVVVIAGGYAFADVEHTTTGEGVWWALVTATTVGYGDVSPHTESGRVIAVVVMIIGTGFIALLTAAAAQRFLAQQIKVDVDHAFESVEVSEAELLAELRDIRQRLDRLSMALEHRRSQER